MNIIHICACNHRPNGIKSVLAKLATEQRKLNHQIRVFSLYEGAEDFQCVNSIDKFYNEITMSRPDIVIFHSLYHKSYIKYALLLALRGIPYAIELHGALSAENYKVNHLKKAIANMLCFNRFIKAAKCIIYLNKAEYDNSIVKRINPQTSIIPNGCDLVVDISPKAYNQGETMKIIYIGRISRHHKGLDLLLEAIKARKSAFIKNKIRFIFYGDGHKDEQEWFLAELAKLPEVTEYRGVVYGEAKDRAMREAELFILTSRYEGMPMGVLEALSYGLPCILTPNTNLGEEVHNAGAGILTSLDINDIAETTLKAVIEYQTNHIELQKKAIEHSKKYSWDKIAQSSIDEYHRMIEID